MTVPDLAERSYRHVPSGKSKPLPDVVGDLGQESVVARDPDFPLAGIQQAALRVFRLGFSIMVAAGESDAEAEAATVTLRGYAEALVMSLIGDPTLGGRVEMASPFLEVNYTPPFVEYEDGTRGREITVNLAVAEMIQVED